MKEQTAVGSRTVVITGASAGIGAAAALALSRYGDHLVLLGRNPAKLAAVARQCDRAPDTFVCDFADLADVRRNAELISATYPVIDVLANNAGLIANRRESTVDGHDVTIQVNHLAPLLLTEVLLDRLVAAPAGRIITTSSAAHVFGRLDPADLDFTRRRWSRWRAYCDSKQANVLFTSELAWRLRETAVVPTCFHPGAVRSDFGQGMPLFKLAQKVLPIGFVTPSQGAATLIHLATTEDGRAIPGGYFDNRQLARPGRRAIDPTAAATLWEVSSDLVARG